MHSAGHQRNVEADKHTFEIIKQNVCVWMASVASLFDWELDTSIELEKLFYTKIA